MGRRRLATGNVKRPKLSRVAERCGGVGLAWLSCATRGTEPDAPASPGRHLLERSWRPARAYGFLLRHLGEIQGHVVRMV